MVAMTPYSPGAEPHHHAARGHLIADRDGDLVHCAVHAGGDLVLHLHRFQHQQAAGPW